MNSLTLSPLFNLLSQHGITQAEVLSKSGLELTDLSQPINLSADQLNVICANALRLTGYAFGYSLTWYLWLCPNDQ